MKVEHACSIIAREQLTPDTVSMTLAVGDMVSSAITNTGRPIHPGQFIHIKCGEGLLLRRPISIQSWLGTRMGGTITVVFEAKGEGTRWLAQRQVGDTLDVLGPLGNGFRTTPGPYLLVGGGIGVPPLLELGECLSWPRTAVLGFRTGAKAFLPVISRFAVHCEKTYLCTDDGSLGRHGLVDAQVRDVLAKDSSFTAVLACGPKPMLKSVAKAAAEFGIPCQVSMEERMACGVGACLGCALPMKDGSIKHVCKDGPVFDAREVDWDA